MSTYFTGITDYIPQAQNFQPDLNFYANVLATKQGQYEQSLQKISSIYGSVLNSPMIRQDNLVRRSDYFKTIEQDVQKIAQMDLSMDQNVQTAQRLFDPILNDKYMVKDMVYTKRLGNSFQMAEQYRNCSDPNKCGGEFWNEGVMALNYTAEEFKNASPEDSLNYQAPKYIPRQNLMKKAFEAAKAVGFNTSFEYNNGRYDITDTNGALLLDRRDKAGNIIKGVLPQYLYGVFGKDQAVQDMFVTEAFVKRKGFIQGYMQENGVDELTAERVYFDTIVPKSTSKIEQGKADVTELRNKTEVDIKAAETLLKESVKGDGIQEAHERLLAIMKNTDDAADHHEKAAEMVKSSSNLNDIKAMRLRVDNIVAQANFQNTIDAAAYDYAMATAKREIKADPYALAAYHNALDLDKAVKLRKLDHEIWLDHQQRLGKFDQKIPGQTAEELIRLARSKGVTMEQLAAEGIDYTNIADKGNRPKLLKLGLFSTDSAEPGKTFVTGEAPVYDSVRTYHDNNKVISEATERSHGLSNAYMKQLVEGMKKEYQKASINSDTKAGDAIREKIIADANTIFRGTGVNIDNVLFGNDPVNFSTNRNLGEMMARAGEMRAKDPIGRVYTNSIPEDTYVQVQLANQVSKTLLNERSKILKEAVAKTISSIPWNGDERRLAMEGSAYAALLGTDGLADPKVAISDYGKLAGKYYRGGYLEAEADFKNNYEKYLNNFTKNLRSLDSKPGFQDEGGSLGVARSIVRNVDAKKHLTTEYLDFQRLSKELTDNPTAAQITPESQRLASAVMNRFVSNNAGNLHLTTQTQFLPDQNQIAMQVKVDEDNFKKIMGLKKSDPVTDEMMTFSIVAPSSLSSMEKFTSKMKAPPADVAMQIEGAVININLPGKGGGSLVRQQGMLRGEAFAYDFDAITGEMKTEPVRIPTPPMREGISIEEAVRQIKRGVDDFDAIAQSKKLLYLNQQRKKNAAGSSN